MKIKILLLIIIIFSFVLRFVDINYFPSSLNWDEISHGYNAYSILKTGNDEWGIKFPLIFRAFGDYKLPLYIYLTVPSVMLFGLNTFSVRLISILAGTLLPLFIYFIVKQIFPKKTAIPLFAASIVAFSPGFIFLSRIALEANLFLCLFSVCIYLLLIRKYPSSSFFYALCLLTYNSSRVILPFYLILLISITVIVLAGVLIIGAKLQGAKRWFVIGSYDEYSVSGVLIQPSEFAKIALIIINSAILSLTTKNVLWGKWKNLLRCVDY